MNRNVTYAVLLSLLCTLCVGQNIQLPLSNASAQPFNRNIFCYGLISGKTSSVCVYRFDKLLQKKDSFYLDLGKTKHEEYLQLSSDTLHDYLNIYVQKKDSKSLRILRFNKQFELMANIDGVEIARLNNSAMFSNRPLYFRNHVYSVNIQADSSGKQFYVNKHEFKSDQTNFEYEFKWQFPFERKNVHSATIFYADPAFLYVYVIVGDGPKTGQWLLKINTADGKLVRGTKLNDKGDVDNYMFGSFSVDRGQKSMQLIGQKFSATQLDLRAGKMNITNAATAGIYVIEIDSLGEVIKRQDLKIPISNVVSGAKNQANGYILKIGNIGKSPIGSILFEADVYKNTGAFLCFLYSNTIAFTALASDDKLVLEKNAVSPNLQIEGYYASKDKLDENGKLCVTEVDEFEKLFTSSPTLPVKLKFRFDEAKNSYWLLRKSNLKKNTIDYSVLVPDKKVYQLTPVEEIVKQNNPGFVDVSDSSYLIFSQVEETKFQLKLYNW